MIELHQRRLAIIMQKIKILLSKNQQYGTQNIYFL